MGPKAPGLVRVSGRPQQRDKAYAHFARRSAPHHPPTKKRAGTLFESRPSVISQQADQRAKCAYALLASAILWMFSFQVTDAPVPL